MNCWMQLSIPGTGDIVAIQIGMAHSKITLFSLYIDCLYSTVLNLLDSSLVALRHTIGAGPSAHILWCSDFNCHHPLWDKDCNKHLFTAVALQDAEQLLALIADHGMVIALPKDIPTLESMATKKWTWPDNVFCTDHTEGLLVKCTTEPCLRGPGTDHVPVLTMLEFPICLVPPAPTFNFCEGDTEMRPLVYRDSLRQGRAEQM